MLHIPEPAHGSIKRENNLSGLMYVMDVSIVGGSLAQPTPLRRFKERTIDIQTPEKEGIESINEVIDLTVILVRIA